VHRNHRKEKSMSQVMSLRLKDETANRLRQTARRAGRSTNEIANNALEEWLRLNEFADIEFRTFNGERHACLKGALQIWQLIMVAKRYDMDAEKTAAHFEFPVSKINAAFNYYEAHREEIDRPLEENESMTYEKLKRILPDLRLIEVPRSVLEGADD
jgi:predicted DNA-binding protein